MNTPGMIPHIEKNLGSSIPFYLLIDPEGKILYANPVFCKRFSIRESSYIGKSASIILDESTKKLALIIKDCMRFPGQAISLECKCSLLTTPFKIKWDFLCSMNEQENHSCIQAVGTELQAGKNEILYHNLFSNALEGIILADEKGIIKFSSPSISKLLGFSPAELIGKVTFDFAHPDDRQIAFNAFMEELMEVPVRKFISVRLINNENKWVWCIIKGHNLMQNPFVKRMVVFIYEDTLRKNSERLLNDNERQPKGPVTILHKGADLLFTTNYDLEIATWDHTCQEFTGITKSHAFGKNIETLIRPDFSPFTLSYLIDIVKTEGIWKGEIVLRSRNGENRFIQLTLSLLLNENGNHTGFLWIGKDITEQNLTREKIQESEIFYRGLSSQSLDGIVMTDEKGKIIYSGPSVKKNSGYDPEQLLGHELFEFVHPEDLPQAIEAFVLEIQRKSVHSYLVLRLKHAARGWIWTRIRAHNLIDNPLFNAVIIYFTDDSQRKEMEEKLRQSEQYFRSLIVNLKQGVLLQDAAGKIIVCNRAAQEMLELTEEQLEGQTFFDPGGDVIDEDGKLFPLESGPVHIAIKTKQPVRDIVMGVYKPISKDRIWLLANAEPILNDEGDLLNVICSFADITEQKKLTQKLIDQEIQKQKQIIQATIDGQEKERQEIGKELHDNINQHLNTTRLYLEVAREKASGDVLEMINLAHKNLSTIVDEIRQMSQSLISPTLGDLGLIESIQDLCDSLKRAYPFNIEFLNRHFNQHLLSDNLKLILFRIVQEQVSNIIRHAQAHAVFIKLQSDAEYITLTIADDGKGFDKFNFRKGLGLTNIANRAALFNGKVEIHTTPGNGCTLVISIPVV